MNSSDFKPTEEFAAQYDDAAQKYGWLSPEVLFGLTYEYLKPGEKILDLGIGTGLGAVPYEKAGLQVFGVDHSRQMLDHAASRGVAIELKQHDIRSTPLPYPDDGFDHIVACGVFHLIDGLDSLFAETARLVRLGGSFAFTVEELTPKRTEEGEQIGDGLLRVTNPVSDVVSYLHSHELIEDLLTKNSFQAHRTLDFVAYKKTHWADERIFRAYVAVKKDLRSP